MANSPQDFLSLAGKVFTRRFLIGTSAFFALAFANASQGRAQSVGKGIPVGVNPLAMTLNPVTKKIYVANQGTTVAPGTTLTAIDAVTGKANDIPIGNSPGLLALNPLTNKIYVGNNGDGDIAVLDGSTNSISTTIPIIAGAMAVNPVTNKIYVASGCSGVSCVKVVDGGTDTVEATIPNSVTGSDIESIAVNPATDMIYVVNTSFSSVTVIDGSTQAATTVALSMDLGNGPVGVRPTLLAVNPVKNKVYVGLAQGVMVLDGATNVATQIFSNVVNGSTNDATSISINPVTNKIYVGYASRSPYNNVIGEIDGATNTETLISTGNVPSAVAVDVSHNVIYVANTADGTVMIIDGATRAELTLSVGQFPIALAVDTRTGDAYVLNQNWQLGMTTPPVAGTVQVISGSASNFTISAGFDPSAVDVDPVLNKAYIANAGSNDVTVIDGATNSTTTIPAGTNPFAVAADPITGKAFVVNRGSDTATAINGTTNATTTIHVGMAPTAVAVNPVTGTVYVANSGSNDVTVINEAAGATATVATGSTPVALVVNQATNRIYVADRGSNDVTVINGTTNTTSFIPVGSSPSAVAVNPATNKIFVANQGSNDVTVIDGATGTTSRIAVGTTPVALAVNPATNEIYVVDQGSDDVMVIDGTNSTASPVAVGMLPQAVTIDVARNKVYVADGGSNGVTVIEGATRSTRTVPGGASPVSLAVNLITGKVYVADFGDEATVIVEPATQPIPLVTQIAPFPGNITTGPAPTFTFTTSSLYAPTAPPVLDAFYQVDTLQGPSSAASGSGPNFTGQTQPLTFGTHILYAYALDAQISLANGQLSGPASVGQYATGSLTAYLFMAVPPSTQTTLTSDKNPSQVGDTVNFTAVVAPAPPATGTPTGAVYFFDGTTLLGSVALDSSGQAAYATSALTAGTHQIGAKFEGDSAFGGSVSGAVTQTVNENFTTSASPSALTITHGQSQTSTITVSPAGGADTVAITFSCTGLPAGSTCTFNPASVTPGSSPATTALTIQTAGSAAVPAPFDLRAPPFGLMLLLAFAAALGIGTTLRDARRTRLCWVSAACLLTCLGLLAIAVGCGGGTGTSAVGSTPAPTGNFTVTVHATAGSVDKITTIALTVN